MTPKIGSGLKRKILHLIVLKGSKDVWKKVAAKMTSLALWMILALPRKE
jgi:hypothetical protein